MNYNMQPVFLVLKKRGDKMKEKIESVSVL